MRSGFLIGMTVLALGTAAPWAPAWAGFTLVAPDAAPAPAVPTTPIQTGNIATVPMQQTTISSATITKTPLAPPVTVTSSVSAPPVLAQAPGPSDQKIVHGFGKDIPLVIAAQQIAPADRQIAFGQGVDPSMPISWQGGRNWRSVLSGALSQRGLQMTEQGNLLFIAQNNPTDAGVMKPAQLAPPAQAHILPANITAPIPGPAIISTPMPPLAAADQNGGVAPAHTMITVQSETTTMPVAAPVSMPPRLNLAAPSQSTLVSVTTMAPILDGDTSWHAVMGHTLKQTLESWSQRAHVTLRWDSEFDYPVQSDVNVDGDYETAVRTLLHGFSSAQPQPVARLYRPDRGLPGVLLVTARGNDMSSGQ